jgi:hypothetical protein
MNTQAPPPQSTSDWMLQHLANVSNAFSRVGNRTLAEAQAIYSNPAQVSNDLATTIHQGYTLGLDDPAMAAATGVPLDQYRQNAATANQRLGFAAPFASALGYWGGGFGPSAIGVASKVANMAYEPIANAVRPTVARYLSGVLGAAGEGGLSSYIGSAARGGGFGNDVDAALSGTIVGGILGGGPGGVQSEASAPSAVPALKAQETKVYSPLDDITFHGSDTVKANQDTTNNIINAGGANALTLAKSTNAIVEGLNNQTSHSASDLQDAQEKLWDLSRSNSAGDEDKRFAPLYAQGLDDVHENATPIAGTVNDRPAQAGDAADILAQGKPITAQRKNAEMLDRWARQADITGNPYYPASAAQKELSPETGNPQYYATRDPTQQGGYDISDPRYQRMNALGQTVPAGGTNYPYQTLKHALPHLIESALAGGAGGEYLGHPIAGAGTALGLYGALSQFGRAQSAYRAAQPRAAYENLYPTLTGGNQAPIQPSQPAPIRDALRQLLFGTTATGWTPY